jgi:transcriptional regulator with XRE-family HTH domain
MDKYIAISKPVPTGSYAQKVQRRANSLEGRQAAMKLAVADELWMALERTGTAQAELARRAGTSPQYITKVFRGTTNFTLESMVGLFYHLGHEFEISARSKPGTANGIEYFRTAILSPDAIPGAGWNKTGPAKEKTNDSAIAA